VPEPPLTSLDKLAFIDDRRCFNDIRSRVWTATLLAAVYSVNENRCAIGVFMYLNGLMF